MEKKLLLLNGVFMMYLKTLCARKFNGGNQNFELTSFFLSFW